MSRLRKVERRRSSLVEIRNIMNSVKSLAYIETRKLGRVVEAQRRVIEQVERVAADFLSFHPRTLPEAEPATKVVIVVGSERGFCGDFNQRLLAELGADAALHGSGNLIVLAVGRKLHSILEEGAPIADQITLIDGAGIVEEVAFVLDQAVSELDALQKRFGALNVSSLYHGDKGDIRKKEVLPSFRQFKNAAQQYPYPPLLNLPPDELFVELGDQYLLASLYEILHTSLMQENLRRVTHLADAVAHLDDKSARLAHEGNALRQEEITEEIEVILLSSASVVGH